MKSRILFLLIISMSVSVAQSQTLWGNNNSRTDVRNDAGLQGDAGAVSGFFETSYPVNYPAGATSWWHLLDVRHSNLGNNYAMQFAGSFYDQELWFRKTNNNPTQGWSRILTTQNRTLDFNAGGSLELLKLSSSTGGNNSHLTFWLNRHGNGNDWNTAATRLQAVTDVTGQGYLEFNPPGDLYGVALGTGARELMRMRNNGNIGIGVKNPWARLDVRTEGTSAGDQSALNLNNPSNDAYATVSITMGLNSATSAMISAQRNNTGNGSSLFFHTADQNGVNHPRMWISDAGNVGIGTLNPGGKLQVSDGAEDPTKYGSLQLVRPSSPSDNAFHLSFIRSGMSVAGMGYANNSNVLGIWHSNSNASTPTISFLPDQTVGIGTSDTKGYRLAVNGNAVFTKIKVREYANWPDYVFEDGYNLPSLSEVEKFIQKNKHLPEVPSAKEVKENGIDVGDNQALLLRKIEELTLYMIEQNKRLEKQDRIIEEQQKRIEALEKK